MPTDPGDSVADGVRMSGREYREMVTGQLDSLAREIKSMRLEIHSDIKKLSEKVAKLEVLEERRFNREHTARNALYLSCIAAGGWIITAILSAIHFFV